MDSVRVGVTLERLGLAEAFTAHQITEALAASPSIEAAIDHMLKQKQLEEKNAQSAATWACVSCTFENANGAQACEVCGAAAQSPEEREQQEWQREQERQRKKKRLREEEELSAAISQSQETATSDMLHRLRKCNCRREGCSNTVTVDIAGRISLFCSIGCAEVGAEDKVVGTRGEVDALDMLSERASNAAGGGGDWQQRRCALQGCNALSQQSQGQVRLNYDWHYCCEDHAQRAHQRGEMPPATPGVNVIDCSSIR